MSEYKPVDWRLKYNSKSLELKAARKNINEITIGREKWKSKYTKIKSEYGKLQREIKEIKKKILQLM